LVARRRICTRTYVRIAQSSRDCTIFKCVTTIRLCHLQRILLKLALLAYIDTLVVHAKRTNNKLVVHVKTTRDQRPLSVTNQKGWNAVLPSTSLREVIPLMTLMKELPGVFPIHINKPNFICKVHEDNQSCIKMAHSDKFTPRTKHIALKYHRFKTYAKN